MKTVLKYLKRLLAYPFVLGFILVSYNFHALRNSFMFLLHGGEWNTYTQDDQKLIQDVYLKLLENEGLVKKKD